MNDFIEALKEIKKESKDFKITLSKKEVLEITDEIDRLHSIIKEVREYIEDNKEYTLIEKSSNQDFKGIPTFYYTNEDILNQEMIEKVLEILDKESSNGSN